MKVEKVRAYKTNAGAAKIIIVYKRTLLQRLFNKPQTVEVFDREQDYFKWGSDTVGYLPRKKDAWVDSLYEKEVSQARLNKYFDLPIGD